MITIATHRDGNDEFRLIHVPGGRTCSLPSGGGQVTGPCFVYRHIRYSESEDIRAGRVGPLRSASEDPPIVRVSAAAIADELGDAPSLVKALAKREDLPSVSEWLGAPDVEEEAADDGLDDLTVADLLDVAEERGVEIPSRTKRGDIIALIRAEAADKAGLD